MVFPPHMVFVNGFCGESDMSMSIYKLDDLDIVKVFGLDDNEMLLVCGLKSWSLT